VKKFVVMSSTRLAGEFSDLNVRDSTPSLDNFVLGFILSNDDGVVDQVSDLVDEDFQLLEDGLFVFFSLDDLFIQFLSLGNFFLKRFLILGLSIKEYSAGIFLILLFLITNSFIDGVSFLTELIASESLYLGI